MSELKVDGAVGSKAIKEQLAKSSLYRRSGEVWAFEVLEGSYEIGVGGNNKKMTANTGDFIVCSVESRTFFIINSSVFNKTYEQNKNGGVNDPGMLEQGFLSFTPKELVKAFQYKGESMPFSDPAGRETTCKNGDYIVAMAPEFTRVFVLPSKMFENSYEKY